DAVEPVVGEHRPGGRDHHQGQDTRARGHEPTASAGGRAAVPGGVWGVTAAVLSMDLCASATESIAARTGGDQAWGAAGPPNIGTGSCALGRRRGCRLRQVSTSPRSCRGTRARPSGPSTPLAAKHRVEAHENTSVAGVAPPSGAANAGW